jgi:tetratricopeptide (TPR) repeat protein
MNDAPSFPSISVSRGTFALFVFGFASLTAAEPTEVIKLPDLTIHGAKELPPPEDWLYGRMDDGTEVLTNASERSSKRLLRDFQLFQQALEVVWPLPQTGSNPARSIILCGRQNKFSDFTASGHNAGSIGSTSLFVRDREQAAIVVDLQTTSIILSGLVDDEGATTSNFEVDPYKQLYREYVRYQLSQGSRPPAWLQEGIAQIVMAMEFTPEWIIFGKIDSRAYQPAQGPAPTEGSAPDDGTEDEEAVAAQTSVGDRPFNVALRRRALIPLDKFFSVTSDSSVAKNPLGNNRWAKQAYAFVHLCLYGENGRFQQAFGQFTQRLGKEPVSEALFKECFKMSYQEMLLELRGYIGFTNHTYKQFKLKPGGRPLGGAPVALRDATQAEVGRIKGDAQRLAGQTERALDSYRVAYARGERDPALLAALGSAENAAGHTERALTLMETAAKTGLSRPSAHVELARLRLTAAKAKPARDGDRLSDAQMTSVLEPLFKARQLRPPLSETYETIAEAWLVSATMPKTEHLAVLVEGLRLFPYDNPQFLRLAELYRRIGDEATATSLAQAGLRLAKDAGAKALFEQFLASPSPVKTNP